MVEFTFSIKRVVGLLLTFAYGRKLCVNMFFSNYFFFKKIERSKANTCVIFIKTNRRLRTGIGDSNEHVKVVLLEHF